MKIRIRFGKHGAMKYIGHLDIMRYFQKAMRRAAIPMKFSQGYHPHPIISFAEPLGLGITSDGEYMDIETEEDIDGPAAMKALGEAMVDGMVIHSLRRLPENAKNAMASVEASSYRLTYRRGKAPLQLRELIDARDDFYDRAEHITIVKKTKKSERSLDLKPLIYRWEIEPFVPNTAAKGQSDFPIDPSDEECGSICHRIMLSSGSTDNIKPDLVMEHFHRFLGLDPQEYAIRVYREDMFTRVDGQFVSLEDVGEEIF